MSNIPKAREILEIALVSCGTVTACKLEILAALKILTREQAVTRAKRGKENITPAVRMAVFHYAYLGLPQHDIANRVGLRSVGRVSEILNGLR